MPKRKKLVEKYWAIRVGTFESSVPYFMLREDDSVTPQLFASRREARKYKREWKSSHPSIRWLANNWTIVPTNLGER